MLSKVKKNCDFQRFIKKIKYTLDNNKIYILNFLKIVVDRKQGI